MKKQELLDKLQLPDPFEGFVPVENPTFFGWNGDGPLFGQLIENVKPSLVVEVGSWLGQSSINMAANIKGQGMGETCTLVCIDTWLGSKEHWCDPELRKHMKLKNGYPTFHGDFMSNVLKAGVQDVVLPLPMTSMAGACLVKDFKLSPNLVYIDGSHELRDVYNDLEAWWEVLAPGGACFGDDMPINPVSTAVHAFCAEVGVPLSVYGVHWVLRKPAV